MEYKIDEVGLQKHREQTVEEILELLRFHDRVACVRYTGFGKSYYVVPELIRRLNAKCLIVVPSTPLYQQYKDNFMNNENVEILTYQIIKNLTKTKIKQKYLQYNYVICDECHHLGENKWKNEFSRLITYINAKVIGLTATPLRGDGTNVVNTFFNNVQVLPLELLEGISLHYLPKIKYVVAYASIDELDDSALLDIDRYKIENLLNVSTILKEHITSDYLKHNLKLLVYVTQVKHISEARQQCSTWFKEAFPEKTINIYDINSLQKTHYNKQQLRSFKQEHDDNTIDIMVSVNMLTEGLHLPNIDVEIMLRKTKSPVVYFQQLGRVVNGGQPLIIDLINNGEHLKGINQEYMTCIDQFNALNKHKLLFEDCVELIDKTVELDDILQKYRFHTSEIGKIILANRELIESKSGKVSIREMCEELGVSYSSFCYYINKFNINFVSYRPHVELTPNDTEFIDNNYTRLSVHAMSKQLCKPPSIIIKYMDMNGYARKRVYSNVNMMENKILKIRYLYNNCGFSKTEIAKLTNLSEYYIDFYLMDYGFDITEMTREIKYRMAEKLRREKNLTIKDIAKILQIGAENTRKYLKSIGVY